MKLCRIWIGVLIVAYATRGLADDTVAEPPRVIEKSVETSDYTIVDHGAPASRAALRYKLRPGMRATGTIEIDENVWGIEYPRIVLHIASEVTGGRPGGKITFRETITKVVIEPNGSPEVDRAGMQQAFDTMVGLSSQETIDARGIISKRKLIVPHAADARALEKAEGYLGGLGWMPEPAVGVGATWRSTHTSVDDDGRTVAHTTTVVLKARRGDELVLEKTSSSSGGAQALKDGIEVKAATGRSGSRRTMSLDKLAWSWSYESTAEYQAVKDGTPMTVQYLKKTTCTGIPE